MKIFMSCSPGKVCEREYVCVSLLGECVCPLCVWSATVYLSSPAWFLLTGPLNCDSMIDEKHTYTQIRTNSWRPTRTQTHVKKMFLCYGTEKEPEH